MRVWVTSKPEVWPVIGCIAVGGAWLGFVVSRFMFLSPDTQWSKADRGNMFRTNFQEGKSWTSHRMSFVKDDATISNTSVIGMATINKIVGGSNDEN